MKAGDQIRIWHVCPAALRAILRKALSRGTASKLNFSPKRNENINVNDEEKKKNKQKKVIAKGGGKEWGTIWNGYHRVDFC